MRAREAGIIFSGQLIGRAIQEGSELLPIDPKFKRIARVAIGAIETAVAVTQQGKIPRDVETILGISGTKILADELVDFILELFAKPAAPAAAITVPVTPRVEVKRAGALW